MKVKTKSGFKCEISDDVINNMELVDAIANMQHDEDLLAISTVANILFGKDKKALYEHLREEDGRVPINKVSDAIKDVFESFGQREKNS